VSGQAELRRVLHIIHRTIALGVLANGLGAAVVFIAGTLTLPREVLTPHNRSLFALAMSLYMLVVGIYAVFQARRMAEPLVRPVREQRPASVAERRLALALPFRQATWYAAYWLLAGALNVPYEVFVQTGFGPGYVARGVISILLGGVTTCTLAFFVIERSMRPLLAATLGGEVGRPRALSIGARLLLSWGLGSGISMIAIILALAGLEGLDRGRLAILGIVLAVIGLVVGGLTITVSAASVADPLQRLRDAMQQVQDGVLDVSVTVDDAGEVGVLQAGFNEMVRGLRERERLHDLFGRHVGIDVARQAMETTELGGEVRQASALFVDVTASTGLAETRPPTEVVAMLNDMFDAVVRSVSEEGGWVNKFEGDAALCVFGAPAAQPDHAARALRAARRLHEALDAVVAEHPGLDIGVGVSSGNVVAGNIGAEERYEYTVIGDAVNEAARLTDLAKEHPSRVLASGRCITAAHGDEAAHWRCLGSVRLRGRSRETELYTLAP